MLPEWIPTTSFEVRTAIEEGESANWDGPNNGRDEGQASFEHPRLRTSGLPNQHPEEVFPLVIFGLYPYEQRLSSVYYETRGSDSSLPPEIAIVKECVKAVDSNVVLHVCARVSEEMKLIAVHCEESIKLFHRWAGTTSGYKALLKYQKLEGDKREPGERTTHPRDGNTHMDPLPVEERFAKAHSHIGRRQFWYPSLDCSLADDVNGRQSLPENALASIMKPSTSSVSPTPKPFVKAPHAHTLKGFPLIDHDLTVEICIEQVCDDSTNICEKEANKTSQATKDADVAKKEKNEEEEKKKNGVTFKIQNTISLCCPRNDTAIRKHCEIYSRKNSQVLWILFALLGGFFLFSTGAIAFREIRDLRRRRSMRRSRGKVQLISVDEPRAIDFGVDGAGDGCREDHYGTILSVRNHPSPSPKFRRPVDIEAAISDEGPNRRMWYQMVLPQQAARDSNDAATDNMGLRRITRGKVPLQSASQNRSCPHLPMHARSSSIDLTRPTPVVQSSRHPSNLTSEHDRPDRGGTNRNESAGFASPSTSSAVAGLVLGNSDHLVGIASAAIDTGGLDQGVSVALENLMIPEIPVAGMDRDTLDQLHQACALNGFHRGRH